VSPSIEPTTKASGATLDDIVYTRVLVVTMLGYENQLVEVEAVAAVVDQLNG
jgi:hypothetical protein